MPAFPTGFDAVVAARRSGFTEEPVGGCVPNGKSLCGVFAPVPVGVERLEGSSEVNMVRLLGEMR